MGSSLSERAYPLSLWHETTPTDWTPRPAAGRRHRGGRGDRRRRLHRSLDGALPGRGRPVAADRGGRGRGGRLRRVGAQRRLVLGAVPRVAEPRWPGWPGRTAALAQHAAMRDSVDEVARVCCGRGHRRPAGQGRHRRAWPAAGRSGRAPSAEVEDAREWGRGEDDLALLDAGAAAARLRATRHARGDVHPGLRGAAPRPAGPRAGRGRGAARGADRGAHARHGDRARPGADDPRAWCARRTSCGRPRGTRPGCRARGGRWRRSTR